MRALSSEATQKGLVPGKVLLDELDRNPLVVGAARPVHDPHPADAEY